MDEPSIYMDEPSIYMDELLIYMDEHFGNVSEKTINMFFY